MRPSEFMQTNPVRLDISRSRFHMDPRWTGTFESFSLVPIFTYGDVLPGDTFKVDVAFALRMSTPAAPVMDDLFLDVAFYFIPYDLVLSRSYMSPSTSDSNHSWKAIIGAQDSLLNMPIPASGLRVPMMELHPFSGTDHLICDCMGLPNIPNSSSSVEVDINPLPFLSFMALWNENYRDPNAQNPGVFSIVSGGYVSVVWEASKGDANASYDITSFKCPNVCRFHGYFGSALPWPQRNLTGVTLPVLQGLVPVETGAEHIYSTGYTHLPLKFGNVNGSTLSGDHVTEIGYGATPISKGTFEARDTTTANYTGGYTEVYPNNLWADLNQAAAISVNAFRQLVQQQRWYEALARSGNNGEDVLTAGMFGVVRKDAGYNKVEYLGGKRIPINVTQVNSTADTGTTSGVIGETGAFSLTNDKGYYFTKSFDTWGCIIGVCCVRYRDSFTQGVNKMWRRFERFDYYWPQFANLGEQAIKREEIYATGTIADDIVFGYQEAWAEYRMIPDVVTGLTRPSESLGHWTYANNFASAPTLADYIQATNAKDNVDRTLLVSSSTSDFQFFGQFQFDIVAVRPIPTYSIPGLVDHH